MRSTRVRRLAIWLSAAPRPQLQDLVDKWLLGEDLPTIDMQNLSGESVSYAPASGTLFGSGGPSYRDLFQGAEGDCWLLASFAETAAIDPSVIQSAFTDDGTEMENGVQAHVWTVRFYYDGVTSYITVNNELPASNGDFVYAGGFQPINNSSNVLWVPLLEKAYAQLAASGWTGRPQENAYSDLSAGNASSALPVITGVQENSSDALASQSSLVAAIAAETLITLGSYSDGGDSAPNSLGVVPGHEYAVLGYNATNQTFSLLNPWGWNNTNAPGILNLTWSQITQNFYLDGDCSTASTAHRTGSPMAEPEMSRPATNGPVSLSLRRGDHRERGGVPEVPISVQTCRDGRSTSRPNCFDTGPLARACPILRRGFTTRSAASSRRLRSRRRAALREP